MESEADAPTLPVVPRTLRIYVPTLREVCATVLGRYPHCLGDLGYIDVDSLRSVAWNCNVEQLARIEDETLSGSGRNLEWYTWHLWKRRLTTELGLGGMQAPPLESPMPVDYMPPRGIPDEPADYRALYMQRKAEVEKRAAAARERIAEANALAQEMKDSHKAKMIDKLAPAKRRGAGSTGSGRGAGSAFSSAFMHKPRPDSRSTILSKPGGQLKLLKDLGLVKPAAKPAAAATVRIIRSSPVPAAATGRSSSLAGAELLSRATGGQLGRTGQAGRLQREETPPPPPQVAARAAAVAAMRAAGSSAPPGFRSAPPPVGGVKRPAGGTPEAVKPPPNKVGRVAGSAGGPAGSANSGNGDGGPPRPDPRVMFPRQAPPPASPGQSKFAVPTVRPLSAGPGAQQQQRGLGGGAGSGAKSTPPGGPAVRTAGAASKLVAAGGARAAALRPVDDL